MSARGRTRRSISDSTDEKPSVAPCSWNALAMPHAIEWSFATPKIERLLPVEQSHAAPPGPRNAARSLGFARAHPRPSPRRRPRAAARPRRRDRPRREAGRGIGPGDRGAGAAWHPVPDRDQHLAREPIDARRAGARRWARRSPPSASSRRCRSWPPTPPGGSPAEPLYVLDLRRRPDGIRRASASSATKRRRSPDARAAAVVVGDSPEAATWDNLNRAFRLIRNGAELIGMHKNRWWLTPDGPTIDSGAFVAGLEFSAGVKARIVGKPAREFFTEAANALAAEARSRGEPPLRRRDIAHGRRRSRDRRPGRPAGRPPRSVRADRQAHPRGPRDGGRARPNAAGLSSRICWPTWSPR